MQGYMHELNKKSICHSVRKERQKTQDEMAVLMDISRPSYTQYETGVSFPKFENLMKIAEILDVSIDYLVGLTNKKN